MAVISRNMCYYHSSIFKSNPWHGLQRMHDPWMRRNHPTTTSNPVVTFAANPAFFSSQSTGSNEDINLVYSGNLYKQVKMIKWFSLSTTAVGLSIQPFIWNAMNNSTSFSSSFMLGFAATTAAAVVMTPLVLNLVTKRYVTRLYFEPNDKKFELHSLNFFNRPKTTEFTAGDVKIPTVTGPFTSFTVFGRPFFVDPLAFKDLSVYEHLMGFDKLDMLGRPLERTESSSDSTSNDSVEKEEREAHRQ